MEYRREKIELAIRDYCLDNNMDVPSLPNLAGLSRVINDIPCPSCAALRAEVEKYEEHRCRMIEAIRPFKEAIHYKGWSRVETEIFGSFSCPHREEVERLEESIEYLRKEWTASPERGLNAIPQLIETCRRAKEG